VSACCATLLLKAGTHEPSVTPDSDGRHCRAPFLRLLVFWAKTHLFRRCFPWRHSPCSVPEKWHFDITDTLIVRFTYLLLTTDNDGPSRSSFLATVNVGRQWGPSGRTNSRQGRLFHRKVRPFTWPSKMLASFDFGGFFLGDIFCTEEIGTFHRHS